MLTLDPRLQQTLLESVRPGDGGAQLVIDPGLAERLINQIVTRFGEEAARGAKPVLVCVAQIRAPLRRLVRLAVPSLPILSYPELSVGTATVNALGVIDDRRGSAAEPIGVGATGGNAIS